MLPPETDLHVASALPDGEPWASLLFVHGAYVDNWCWEPYFLPHFASRGFGAHALSLRGHGRSGGRSTLFAASLDDYAADVCAIAGSLPAPLVLVGHSMGATVVERVLESRDDVQLAVLLAPVPPGGLMHALHDLLATRPDLLVDFQQLEAGHPTPAALEALRPLYFTDNVRPQLLWEAVMHTQPESQRALLDLTFRWPAPMQRRKSSILVVAAALDRLFPPAQVEETAARHGTRALVLEELPHMLMLDDSWQSAADPIAAWIEAALRRGSA